MEVEGGVNGGDGILWWREMEEEEGGGGLCFRDHRHLYSLLIDDGVRKEVRHGHGAP